MLKTCCKLGLSFFAYLGDRLGLNTGQPKIPPLADLVISGQNKICSQTYGNVVRSKNVGPRSNR